MGARGPAKAARGITTDQVARAIKAAGKRLSMTPPATLDATGKRIWNRYAPVLLRLGIVTPLDTTTLETYCDTYSRYVEAVAYTRKHGATMVTNSGYPTQRPEVAIAAKCASLLLAYGRDLGLTPAIRARLEAAGGDDGDELEEFLEE